MIPMLAFTLVVLVVVAWGYTRHRKHLGLQRGEALVHAIDAEALKRYAEAQSSGEGANLTVLRRLVRLSPGTPSQPSLFNAQGWRLFYLLPPTGTQQAGLEIVIDTDGTTYVGSYEYWEWDAATGIGTHHLESFEWKAGKLTFTPVFSATFGKGTLTLDQTGLPSTPPQVSPLPEPFLPPSHMLPAMLKLSQDQTPSAQVNTLQVFQTSDRVVTQVRAVSLLLAKPHDAPREMGAVTWAAARAMPGSDLPASTFYFDETGKLVGIVHAPTANGQTVEELPRGGQAIPAETQLLIQQVLLRNYESTTPAQDANETTTPAPADGSGPSPTE